MNNNIISSVNYYSEYINKWRMEKALKKINKKGKKKENAIHK